MEAEYNWEEITRYVLNECSDEEKKEIESRIKFDSNFSKAVKDAQRVASVKQKPFQTKDINLKWEEVKADLVLDNIISPKQEYHPNRKIEEYNSKNRSRKMFYTAWRYAAIIVFTIGMSYFLSKEFISPETIITDVEYKTLSVNSGERKTIVLYDGTTINLDSGSELKYPNKFGATREVYLKGEGYFQVTKNPNKPFRIHANNALIQVLGTKFNIRNWAEDNEGVIVTVSEGKVALGDNNSAESDKVYLTKNMQSSVLLNGKTLEPITVNASNFSRWMNNEKHFKDASLKQILSQLERWYDIEFEVEKELLQRKNLTVHLDNTNLDELLELISAITNTKVQRHGKKIKFIK